MGKFADLSGMRYGNIKVQWPIGRVWTSGKPAIVWLYVCDCGALGSANSGHIKSLKSCGCVNRSKNVLRLTRHGMTGTGAHRSYCLARARCNYHNSQYYKYYGGRGIQFRFSSFEEFYEALGDRPSGKTLDRINHNGHYELGNVRWATRKEQAKNRRPSRKREKCHSV